MTHLQAGKPLYVAAARLELARMFATNNGVDLRDLHVISPDNLLRGRKPGATVYVIGEIGREVAEEIHIAVTYRQAKVVYLDVWDKIHA